MTNIYPINHLYESAHCFDSADSALSSVNLTPIEWNRFTVNDGDWMQNNTLSPLSARDVYIANLIDDYSAYRDNRYSATSGLYINKLNNTLNFIPCTPLTSDDMFYIYKNNINLYYDGSINVINDYSAKLTINNNKLIVSSNSFKTSSYWYIENFFSTYYGSAQETATFDDYVNIYSYDGYIPSLQNRPNIKFTKDNEITAVPYNANYIIIDTISSNINYDKNYIQCKITQIDDNEPQSAYDKNYPIIINKTGSAISSWKPVVTYIDTDNITYRYNYNSGLIPDGNVLIVY